jgi:hypothetical protein
MINSPREKILASLAAASVAVALLLESGFELPLQPFADLDTAITEATTQADDHQRQVNRLLHDLHALEEAANRSLPADPGRRLRPVSGMARSAALQKQYRSRHSQSLHPHHRRIPRTPNSLFHRM